MDVDFEEENLRSLQIEEDEGPIRPSSRIRRRIRIESEVSRPNTAQLADTPRIRIDGVSVAYRYRIRIRYVIRQQGGVSVLYSVEQSLHPKKNETVPRPTPQARPPLNIPDVKLWGPARDVQATGEAPCPGVRCEKDSHNMSPEASSRKTRLPVSRIWTTGLVGEVVRLVDHTVRLVPSKMTRLPSRDRVTEPEESVRGVSLLATQITVSWEKAKKMAK
ncbi:hypothetical protein SASPL_146491 [Salvia splendens]|uniref:Uncharacterized protein n=1 Tax=Salvia splendens TaxID=180675 RepID=A0A8X8Z4Y2_SALSN|nr:hypothetical protein SASPL_146491 [Salvia splendens]